MNPEKPNMNPEILEIDEARWQWAQHDEHHYWKHQGPDGDDWNHWWQIKFEDYAFLKNLGYESLLEVGCGPFAQNTRRISALIPSIVEFAFEDPLIDSYIQQGCEIGKMPGQKYSERLEDMPFSAGQFDVIVCINVLDHVQSVPRCFDTMYRHLKRGGTLIVGNCLSNEDDLKGCPEAWTDSKHPIKMHLGSIAHHLFLPYQTTFVKILDRSQGRNPPAHYATLLWAGRKI